MWVVAWISFWLYFIVNPGAIDKIVTATLFGALLAVEIATGSRRCRTRQPLLGWPPNESGIQHWRKKREQRLQATDDSV
jgi:hypothetical protein